jgi:hypothetical protein
MHRIWAHLCLWSWVTLVCLTSLGIMVGLIYGDHRLASRSAAVLLISCGLFNLQPLVV